MGFSFRAGCVERPKECWDESHNINGAAPAKGTYTVRTLKEKPAGVNRRALNQSRYRSVDRKASRASRVPKPSAGRSSSG